MFGGMFCCGYRCTAGNSARGYAESWLRRGGIAKSLDRCFLRQGFGGQGSGEAGIRRNRGLRGYGGSDLTDGNKGSEDLRSPDRAGENSLCSLRYLLLEKNVSASRRCNGCEETAGLSNQAAAATATRRLLR